MQFKSYLYIFATQCRRTYIFQTRISIKQKNPIWNLHSSAKLLLLLISINLLSKMRYRNKKIRVCGKNSNFFENFFLQKKFWKKNLFAQSIFFAIALFQTPLLCALGTIYSIWRQSKVKELQGLHQNYLKISWGSYLLVGKCFLKQQLSLYFQIYLFPSFLTKKEFKKHCWTHC